MSRSRGTAQPLPAGLRSNKAATASPIAAPAGESGEEDYESGEDDYEALFGEKKEDGADGVATTSAAVAAAAPVSGAHAFLTQGDIDAYKATLDTWADRQLEKYDSSVIVSKAMDSKHGDREDYAKHLQDLIRKKHDKAAERIGKSVTLRTGLRKSLVFLL